MARCIEPGCPFPVGPRVLVAGDGHGNAISPKLANAQCTYCRGEPECEIAGCTNVAQRGKLCRPCAHARARGQLPAPSGGDWWPFRDVIVWIMRQPEMRGVKFAVEVRDGQRKLVGRDGAFEIVFHSKLWEPLPTNPED